MYGMGPASLASTIKGTIEDAQRIIDDFYKEFPKVKQWIDRTNADAKTYGFVEDMWGRRRRLPDIQMPKFELTYKDESSNTIDFNPILGTLNLVKKEVNSKIAKYEKLLEKANGLKEITAIKTEAKKEGVNIVDNGGYISRAERQCVNARVQGGAATMSKKAMIKVHHDEELQRLGFRLMLAVHDELIGECPKENAERVAERLCEIMKIAALPECQVPFKCDPSITKRWYEDEMASIIQSYVDKDIKNGISRDVSIHNFLEVESQFTYDEVDTLLNSYFDK